MVAAATYLPWGYLRFRPPWRTPVLVTRHLSQRLRRTDLSGIPTFHPPQRLRRPRLDTGDGRFHIASTMQTQAEQNEIAFADFPELNKLCWNEHARTIPAADAYRLYVRNWDFVRRGTLAGREADLVKSLNAQFGSLLDV